MKKLAIALYALVTVALLAWGYYQAIYVAPSDAMQGEISRIIYYHVPSASVAFLFFFLNLVGSIWLLTPREKPAATLGRAILGISPLYVCVAILTAGGIGLGGLIGAFMVRGALGLGALWFVIYIGYRLAPWSPAVQREIADALAVASAEVGVVFCTVVLTTGPLWGRRAWGIWWTWDQRLTTTLVLWVIYVSYLLLRRFAAGPQMQTQAAVLGIFGFLDVPIVYIVTRLPNYRGMHPKPVFGGAPGSGMAPSMLHPFLWNMLAWFAWGVLILAFRYHVERQHQKIVAAEVQRALEA